MTKVVFVEPRGAESNIFDRFMTIPLLGPVYLGTIAEKAGYDVEIINENILGRKINNFELRNADILCVSCITATVNRGRKIAKRYKKLRPDGRTILGGIHASMMPHDVADDFDQVFVGEGENKILDVLARKINDKIIYSERIKDLDKVPLPNLRLIKKWKKIKIWPAMTTRGCPYNCNFCSVTQMFGRKYRMQSIERVMKEIRRYKKGTIFFADDHFAANTKRTEKLLDQMMKGDFDRTWSAQVRTEVTKNPKFVEKMRKAGCKTVYVGLESINPKSLEEMNKHQTVNDIKRSVDVFHDNGIKVHGMFILGNDSDTKKTFRKTAGFCKDIRMDFVQYSILTPLPGTRTYNKLEKEGRLLHRKWDYYDGLHVVHEPLKMTVSELQQGLVDCFSDFYNYTYAANQALNTFVDYGTTLVKNMYQRAHFPSFYPVFIKFVGKNIVSSWVKQNRFYLNYLKKYSVQ